jgi:hypothetical protein
LSQSCLAICDVVYKEQTILRPDYENLECDSDDGDEFEDESEEEHFNNKRSNFKIIDEKLAVSVSYVTEIFKAFKRSHYKNARLQEFIKASHGKKAADT